MQIVSRIVKSISTPSVNSSVFDNEGYKSACTFNISRIG